MLFLAEVFGLACGDRGSVSLATADGGYGGGGCDGRGHGPGAAGAGTARVGAAETAARLGIVRCNGNG